MMGLIALFLVSPFGQTGSQESLSADSFFAILTEVHSPIEDVSFQWESTQRYVGAERVAPETLHVVNQALSGTYVYRNDGSMRVEVYSQPEQGPMRHRSVSVTGGQRRTLTHVPDRGVQQGEIQQADSVAELNKPAWPHRILYLAYFNALPTDVRRTFRHEGWEDIDGHRCAKVSLNPGAVTTPENTLVERLWIDLDRGGHVVQAEYHHQGHLRMRLSNVEVQMFPLSGGEVVWLPVHGQVESFGWLGEAQKKKTTKWFKTPQVREEIHIMADSVKLNTGVETSAISVPFERGVPVQSSLDPASVTGLHVPTTGPSVQEQLDHSLADANNQLIRATSRARSRWSWETFLPIGVGVMALGLLLYLVYLQRRTAKE